MVGFRRAYFGGDRGWLSVRLCKCSCSLSVTLNLACLGHLSLNDWDAAVVNISLPLLIVISI